MGRKAGSGNGDSVVPGLELNEKGEVVKLDFEAQVHSVFANVKAVLDASGSSWEKLVDVTVFLVNMERDFKTFNRIYAEYFPGESESRPAEPLGDQLPTYTLAIELKCIATVKNN